MNMLRRSILFLALMAAPLTLQAQPMVIEPPRGGDCTTLGGTWTRRPVPTCTLLSLLLDHRTLTIRGGAKVVVRAQFINYYGTIWVGDVNELRPGSAELILGEEDKVAGAGVNYGVIYLRARDEGVGLSNRLYEFINRNLIAVLRARPGQSAILNNFGTIFNDGRLENAGFLHNSGRPVQREAARILNRGRGSLTNTGIIENLGVIEGRVIGPCPRNCR